MIGKRQYLAKIIFTMPVMILKTTIIGLKSIEKRLVSVYNSITKELVMKRRTKIVCTIGPVSE